MPLESEGLSLWEAARKVGVPFQREARPEDREFTHDDMRFHYLDWGGDGKQPLIFLHGNAQQGHSWDFVALSMCDSYHVFVPDARGHGDSDWAPHGEYTVDDYVSDLDGFVNSLGLDQFILVGHSMGGRTSYVYASRFPEKIKALVIVDSGPRGVTHGIARMERFKQLPDRLATYEEFAKRVQEYTGRPLWQVLGSLKYTIRQSEDGIWTWKYDKVFRTPGAMPASLPLEKLWECVESIRCPTLIVRGSESDVFAPETMAQMMDVIPDSASVVISRAGHLVAGDNPVDFIEALKDWLPKVV
jgi:esterase